MNNALISCLNICMFHLLSFVNDHTKFQCKLDAVSSWKQCYVSVCPCRFSINY
ncbi:hypothetical protein I79_026039 [Cricetulus griseus]|uniref:Uncharacterized protein n=1 Tax=Cricetulus griseus TaxID=10029 RepID=G3IPV7_CRIGR|nr:hypothetical protein I79_026039 [Cricetulus griseus]